MSDPRPAQRVPSTRRRRSSVQLLASAILLSVPSVACSSSDYRFDVDSVRPLGDQCPKLRVALTNLIIGIDAQEAATLITALADDEVLRADVQLLVAANGSSAALKETAALQAAEDLRQWIGLSCEPLGSASPSPTG